MSREGKSVGDIAAVLGASPSSVSSTLRECRDTFVLFGRNILERRVQRAARWRLLPLDTQSSLELMASEMHEQYSLPAPDALLKSVEALERETFAETDAPPTSDPKTDDEKNT